MHEASPSEYRRICGLAILTFLLGLASALAFIGPLLLVLPFAGLGVGLLALAKIKANTDHLSGRTLAVWGIMLSVLFSVAATVRPVLLQKLLLQQGDAFGQRWMEMLSEGQDEQALQYVDVSAIQRMAPRDAQGKPIRSENFETEILHAFQGEPFIQDLQAAGKPGTIRFYDGAVLPQASSYQSMAYLIYELKSQSPDVGDTWQFVQLGLKKSRSSHKSSGTGSAWSVTYWKIAESLSALVDVP